MADSGRGSTLAVVGGTPVIGPERHRRYPEVTQADRDAVNRVLDSGTLWGDNAPEVVALEEEFADYCGVPYCVKMNSGTAALHAAVVAAGVRRGDEVITSAYSFEATPMAIVHAGAVPVFCDVDPQTFNIDPAKIEALITARTSAILVVHIGGLPADMEAICEVAGRHGLVVIEDAAQAAGAQIDGRRTGSLGSVTAAFSFNGTKCPSGLEGGAFVTVDEERAKAARRLRAVGEDRVRIHGRQSISYWSRGIGYQYRGDEIDAAFTRSQLARTDEYVKRANENAAILTAGLSGLGLDGILPPHVPAGYRSSFYLYRLMFEPQAFDWDGSDVEFRDRVLWALGAEGLVVSIWQPWPLPQHPVWRRREPDFWRPGDDDAPERSWDKERFKVTKRVLDVSVILGAVDCSLHVQEPDLMGLYVEGVEKVFSQLDVALTCPYKPLEFAPAVPVEEL